MREYVSHLHVFSVVALIILTLGFGLGGVHLEPRSEGFPPLGANLSLTVETGEWDSYTETLTHTTGSGAALTVAAPLLSGTDQDWTLEVQNVGTARLCTPSSVVLDGSSAIVPVPPQHLTPYHPTVQINPVAAGTTMNAVDGSGPLYVRLCWTSGAPVDADGAYLSADFPPLDAYTSSGSAAVTRQLNLGVLDATDYAVQSLVEPTSVTPGGWQWADAVPGSSQLAFTAVDTSQTQHDAYLAFLSGILFGVAGGAFVSLVLELLDPFRTRGRHKEPAGSDAA